MTTLEVSPTSVQAAAERIRGSIRRTPTVRSNALSAAIGGEVYLKVETRQATGSYKERGALNAMLLLDLDAQRRGILTVSAGNHGQAVAYHGARLGLKTTVVMPKATPFLKVRRTRDFGAEIVLAGDTFPEAVDAARAIALETGATLIHPYDDADVIAGQGTATLELLGDAERDLDVVLVPVGGGGLIAGAVLALEAAGSHAEIVALQSPLALTGGATIAEGIAVREMGRLPREVLSDVAHDVVPVAEASIETAIAHILEEEKLVVEGAGAVGVAALLADPARFAGKRVGTILTGGNIDLGTLAAVIVRHRMRSGRVARIRVHMVDRPGELASVATAIAAQGANVLDIAHHRVFGSLSAKHAELDVTVEVERPEDLQRIVKVLEREGFETDVVTE